MNTLAKHNESFKNVLLELGFTSRFDGCHHTRGNISITKVLNRFIIGDNEGKTSEHKTFINKEQLEQDIKDFENDVCFAYLDSYTTVRREIPIEDVLEDLSRDLVILV